MSFLELGSGASGRIVPGSGPAGARIAIVGEAPGAHEDQQLKPFVGPAGSVLEQCLHAAGLIKSEVYLTNVVKVRPLKNDISPYYNDKTGRFTDAGKEWVEYLHTELREAKPNIIVTAGGCATAALTGLYKIVKYRGYMVQSEVGKVIPTIHPSAALRGVYLYRHLIAADLKKAKEQSPSSELIRPARQLVYNFTTVTEVMEWLDYYASQARVCFDIEVTNYEVACISMASDPLVAISIPLDSRWSEQDEMLIWRGIQKVLGREASTKVVQNGIFDIHFLLTRCGIVVRGPVEDTMIGHSIMYPELKKGLAFLGSIYCGTQAYWKDAVKFNNIKEEA